nr:phospholipid carrier-dependent glycosyltransferase [Synechococcus elongatus]
MSLRSPVTLSPPDSPKVRLRDRRDALILLGFWLLSLAIDGLWRSVDLAPPAWDQGDHFSRALAFWQAWQSPQLLNGGWWTQLWQLAPTYRGPLTYLLTLPLFLLFGANWESAIASNGLFSGLLLISTYGLGRLYANRTTGLVAAGLSLAAPLAIIQRVDYLIDYSLTAVLTLTWLCLSLWKFARSPKRRLGAAAASGVAIAAVFLTRPTGLIFLWLPLLWLAIAAVGQLFQQRRWQPLAELLVAGGIAGLLSWPWFSTNWLTILSSIANARDWGVKYQEGLEANTLAGWLYYPENLPEMLSPWLFGVLVVSSAIAAVWLWRRGESGPGSRDRWLWLAGFLFGAYLICVLGSTKVTRFFLPLLPSLIVPLVALPTVLPRRWQQALWTGVAAIAIAVGLQTIFPGPIRAAWPTRFPQTQAWPLAGIIERIRETQPQLQSTLAVLTDAEALNAFNLNAEGQKQDFSVFARQTLAPEENWQADLQAFDWFLSKTGDQGVMAGKTEERLVEAIARSPEFQSVGQWPLPDGSQAQLWQRRALTLSAKPSACPKQPLELAVIAPPQAKAGQPFQITYRLRGSIAQLRNSLLLITWQNDRDRLWVQDHQPGLGYLKAGAGCIELEERLTTQAPDSLPEGSYQLQVQRLDRETGDRQILPTASTVIQLGTILAPTSPTALDPVSRLHQLGTLLETGQVDPLFADVSLLNQADPEQHYLDQAIASLQARLEDEPNQLDWLYPLTLSYVLERQAPQAEAVLQRVVAVNPDNAWNWTYLGFVQLYQFQGAKARQSLQEAAMRQPEVPILPTLQAVAAVQSGQWGEAIARLRGEMN